MRPYRGGDTGRRMRYHSRGQREHAALHDYAAEQSLCRGADE
ncbi:hypothetical protein ABTH94_21440 [Acinetobacter baumannii]